MPWEITTNDKYLKALGQEEYDRRVAVARAKTKGIKDWQERMFLGVQLESIALQLTQEQFDKLATLDSETWVKLFYRLAS